MKNGIRPVHCGKGVLLSRSQVVNESPLLKIFLTVADLKPPQISEALREGLKELGTKRVNQSVI